MGTFISAWNAATTIKNETVINANTASRVGSALREILALDKLITVGATSGTIAVNALLEAGTLIYYTPSTYPTNPSGATTTGVYLSGYRADGSSLSAQIDFRTRHATGSPVDDAVVIGDTVSSRLGVIILVDTTTYPFTCLRTRLVG